MIDEKLTKEIVAFLNIEKPTDDDIRNAGMILVRISQNRYRFFNQQLMVRPQRHLEKLKYELNKHLTYRLDGMTLSDVHRLDAELMPKVQNLVDTSDDVTVTDAKGNDIPGVPASKLGIRADHDELPDDIKALWDNNCERWKKMKELFYTCQEIEDSCDRYEHLKILSELYTQYKNDMNKYDSYNPATATAESDAVTDAKKISAARSYISKYRPKFDELTASGDADAEKKLRAKIQQRIDVLTANNAEFSEDMQTWLTDNEFIL